MHLKVKGIVHDSILSVGGVGCAIFPLECVVTASETWKCDGSADVSDDDRLCC